MPLGDNAGPHLVMPAAAGIMGEQRRYGHGGFLKTDVLIIGAGAAGLMCAITAGQRGRRVLVVDHANKVGKKILISGGVR
jgi:NADPH-dependent 2,4-dienoyl-CoA reductase/sulfur reductase-like enzyme